MKYPFEGAFLFKEYPSKIVINLLPIGKQIVPLPHVFGQMNNLWLWGRGKVKNPCGFLLENHFLAKILCKALNYLPFHKHNSMCIIDIQQVTILFLIYLCK